MRTLEKQTLRELKEFCKINQIDSTGKKEQLIKRIRSFNNSSSNMFAEKRMPLQVVEQEISKRFVQLKHSNLYNYFTYGCLYPLALEKSSIYKDENRDHDVLSIFTDHIVLTSGIINKFEEGAVLVEIDFTDIDIQQYRDTDLFYTTECIPVSRIKKLHFKSKEQLIGFLASKEVFADSYVPDEICVFDSNISVLSITIDSIQLPKNADVELWAQRLARFDRLMGMFSFMKNSGLLFAERENRLENYTSGFFSALELMNKVKPKRDNKSSSLLTSLLFFEKLEINNVQRVIFKSTMIKVYNDSEINVDIAIQILNQSMDFPEITITEQQDLRELISSFIELKELRSSSKDLFQKEIFTRPENLPTMALLFIACFPGKGRQSTDKQAVRNEFVKGSLQISVPVAEYILAMLGLYYGYSNLVKEDSNLAYVDPNFRKIALTTQSIKFKMDSYLDRFVVETIFQFVAKETELNDEFQYLDWNSKAKKINLTELVYDRFDYEVFLEQIFGENVLTINRMDKLERYLVQIDETYPRIVPGSTYLINFVQKHFLFDKALIIEMIKANKDKCPIDELEQVIRLDNSRKKK